MATFQQMIDKVRDWSNRDKEVLSDTLITDFLHYAADDAYRTLRIAPLEQVVNYTGMTAGSNTLRVPADAIEFIQLRIKDNNSLSDYFTYDAKADIRSFYDEELCKYDWYYYTREHNNLIVHPEFKEGDEVQLFYYRRLTDIDSDGLVNWLRDENEKILLYGALMHAFDFLAEPEMSQKYEVRFQQEIAELNREDKMRMVTGGNLQQHFTSYGLI